MMSTREEVCRRFLNTILSPAGRSSKSAEASTIIWSVDHCGGLRGVVCDYRIGLGWPCVVAELRVEGCSDRWRLLGMNLLPSRKQDELPSETNGGMLSAEPRMFATISRLEDAEFKTERKVGDQVAMKN